MRLRLLLRGGALTRCALVLASLCAAACAGGEDSGHAIPYTVGSTGSEGDPFGGDDDGTPPPGAGEAGGSETGTDGGCNVGELGCDCAPHDACKLGLECVDGHCKTCAGCGWCGDDGCGAPETCNDCPADCGACDSCGDDICDPSEACTSCPDDCGVCESCGNDICDVEEDCFACEADCGACEAPDPCQAAGSGAGSYCGDGIGGESDVLYTCSASGTTVGSQMCANGCASCPAGTADVCRAAGESVDDACSDAECDYNDDPDGCGATPQWCYQGECQSCSTGFRNCDQTLGCECDGYCSPEVAGLCCNEDNACGFGCPIC